MFVADGDYVGRPVDLSEATVDPFEPLARLLSLASASSPSSVQSEPPRRYQPRIELSVGAE